MTIDRSKLLNFHCPRWNELPDFDIYMDQVIIFINTHIDALNIADGDKPITASMVNNYVKNSIVKAPIKKHYKKYHVAFLIVVSILKKSFSLSEISKMIEVQTNMKKSDLEIAYDTFAYYFEKSLHDIIEKGHFDESDNSEELHRHLLISVIHTTVLKIYTQIELADEKYYKS